VMELLDGETLEARLTRKGGKLPVPEVLWAADRTLRVLAAAHEKGIVHRDIKPENLFLTRDRRLKVLDFGIARFGGARSETRVGTVLGTLAFMPPEQARGDPEVGVRSDLWSVGATMYTLLSGRLVREDADLERLLREAGHAAIPALGSVAPELPAQLAELVDLALLIDAEGRWSSAKAMRSAVRLVHAEIQRPGVAAPAGPDDEDPVSEPSFGFIPTRSIEPPPVSRVATLDEVPQISRLPPPPPDLAVAVRATSLEASLREASMDGVEARHVPSEPGAHTVPAPRPARKVSPRGLPPWVVTMAIAAVATLAILAVLSMR
jgi:serine/threonine protein kinase